MIGDPESGDETQGFLDLGLEEAAAAEAAGGVEGEAAPVAKRRGPQHEFEINDTVQIKSGPFATFSGHVAEINEDQLKLKVLVDIFGRETPVELDFTQVTKV